MIWSCKIDFISGRTFEGQGGEFTLSEFANGKLSMWGSGRLDNLAELRRRWRLPANTSAAEVLAQGYLEAGKELGAALLGDFSFAIFDHTIRRIWLVRDHIGIRPLYYRIRDGILEASDSHSHMLQTDDAAFDQDALAEWQRRGQMRNRRKTFFTGLHKVPGGSVLQADDKGVSVFEYWNPETIAQPDARWRATDEADYIAELHDLLRDAIRVRLPKDGPMAAHSSGGLDSTPLAIMAARAAQEQGRACFTYNWCRPDPEDEHLDLHEWRDARQVAEMESMQHVEIGLPTENAKRTLLEHDVSRQGSTMFEYEPEVLAHASRMGMRHIMSGFGGDELLTERHAQWHGPALRQGHWLSVWREMALEAPKRPLANARRVARIIRETGRAFGWLPDGTRQIALQVQRRQDWFDRLVPGAKLLETWATQDFYLPRTIRQQQEYMLKSGYHQERIESWAMLSESYGIHHVYPLLDKRIVEFALALPARCFFRYGEPRYLYRRALGDALPPPLQLKRKPAEIYRVQQLWRARRSTLLDPAFQERITTRRSTLVDTRELLAACRQLANIPVSDTHEQGAAIRAIGSACLTLNLEGK